MPADREVHSHAQRIIGIALAACEKTVQIVYEYNLRPDEKRHQPWLDRVGGQLAAAYRLLETEVRQARPWLFGDRPLQADVTSVVAFRFTREMLPEVITTEEHPALVALSTRAEAIPEFRAFPFN